MVDYQFQCDFCSGPDWFGDKLDVTCSCPKCGRPPVRFISDDVVHCYLHRASMPDIYTTSSKFLFVTYLWSGHQHAFPNAKLYKTQHEPTDTRITLAYCKYCEAAYQDWQRAAH